MNTKIKILLFILSALFFQNIFAQETWTPTNMVNAPTARVLQSAVWTGSKMVIWGGAAYYNTGGIFDPVSNTWSATSVSNAPQARFGHTAIWTGLKMIIWGGGQPGTYFNSGGIYDPQSDQWSPTSIVNVPSGRSFHTSVWTGSKMIAWGGGSSVVTNTGGIYNPVSNSWVPTSTTNTPIARTNHSAVWTGTKMIIWGGNSSDGLTNYNTGGIYDLVSDTWLPTSTTNAPSPRGLQTAIWTGDKMIIWGGTIGLEAYTNTGGIYDPVNNNWVVMSTVNAPESRDWQNAVWTGSKLVVWGGLDSNYQLNTGGIFDPVSNSWTTTTIFNAPESRQEFSAVWTGSKMIVWGGTHLGNFLNSGGIYSNASVIGIQKISENIPAKFSLSQIYPNPFNPVTKIKFDIPENVKRQTSNVKLIIYDVTGRIVATLINQQLQPWSYSVDWDASNYPSGVYFYQLSIGNEQIATKKMALIK